MAPIVFGVVAILLLWWIGMLLHNGNAAAESKMQAERFRRAMKHRGYGLKLYGLTIALCIVLPFIAILLRLRGEEHASPPHVLLLASRMLALVLIFGLFPLLLFVVPGLRGGKEGLHAVLGWLAIIVLFALAIIGGVMYAIVYSP